MIAVDRIFPIVVMSSIIAFALIHLGVSIGIIVPYRKYGDIFTPLIGISSFNLVISFFGLLTGILGFIAAWSSSKRIGRVVCFIAVLLGVFSLASLITALVLNSKSPDHISSHFAANMLRYQTDAGSRNKIDLLQIKYECCGTDIWIDWSHANLNTTAPVIDGTSTTIAVTTSMGMPTTMGSIATTAPPVITTMGSVATTVPPLVTTDSNVITTAAPPATPTPPITVAVDTTITAAPPATPTPPVTIAVDTTSTSASSRKKRQVVGSYGNIPNLPLSFGVVLPKSCCTPEATLTSNGSDAYCISNANNAVNHFSLIGCARPIDKTAGNQLMGFIIINSIMFVLALVAIPILIAEQSGTT